MPIGSGWVLGLIPTADRKRSLTLTFYSASKSMIMVVFFLLGFSLSVIIEFWLLTLFMNRFLEIDSSAWSGLEETTGYSPAKHHVGAVCCLISRISFPTHRHALRQECAKLV